MTSRSPLPVLKTAYVATVRPLGGLLDRAGLVRADPPPIRQRTRHWLRSLVLVHDSLAIARFDVPWWTYDAIDEVSRWLSERPAPVRVYEFGSGASTFWLARRAQEVHSVEHHRGFAEMIRGPLEAFDHVSLRVVEPAPSAHPEVPSAKEGAEGQDFAAYVHSIDDVPGTFDLVVIDGRAREACLAAATPRLAPDGLIVFDNSRRRRYRSSIQHSGLVEQVTTGLTPTLPYPEQTSLLRPRRVRG